MSYYNPQRYPFFIAPYNIQDKEVAKCAFSNYIMYLFLGSTYPRDKGHPGFYYKYSVDIFKDTYLIAEKIYDSLSPSELKKLSRIDEDFLKNCVYVAMRKEFDATIVKTKNILKKYGK